MGLKSHLKEIAVSEKKIDQKIAMNEAGFAWRQKVLRISAVCHEKCFSGSLITSKAIKRAQNCGGLYRETSDFVESILAETDWTM